MSTLIIRLNLASGDMGFSCLTNKAVLIFILLFEVNVSRRF